MRHATLLTPRNGTITVLVPETQQERERGANVGLPRPYSGLLFDFVTPTDPVMTMAKAPMALQLAYVGPDRRVHTVQTAPARSGTYRSGKPTRWVIETFAMWNLYRPGDLLRIGV